MSDEVGTLTARLLRRLDPGSNRELPGRIARSRRGRIVSSEEGSRSGRACPVLGGFDVAVDGVPVTPSAWSRRHAASLVRKTSPLLTTASYLKQVLEHAVARPRHQVGRPVPQGRTLRPPCAR